jgi:mannitol-1-phosphate 5-dehydrogenase
MLGAGAVGRGFIAPLFAAAGWEVVFVDLSQPLIAELQARGRYQLRLVDATGERIQEVAPVRAISGQDAAAVSAALATCDLAATAVGVGALPHLAPLFAAALQQRRIAGTGPLQVLIAENGLSAASDLRQAVLAAVPAAERDALGASFACIRTTIGRMVPPPGVAADLSAEPWAQLPVERAAWLGAIPEVPGMTPEYDFALAEALKLQVHNLTHAVAAYHGGERGHATIAAAIADPTVRREVEACVHEIAAALEHDFGAVAGERARTLAADLLIRYANPRLADPLPRVARDPWRKLGRDERLVGAARRCLAAGVRPKAIARAIAAALRHQPAADEPGAQRWLVAQAAGPEALLAACAGELPEDLLRLVRRESATAAIRRKAAARLSAAGVVLRPAEAAEIEVADFGLGRFADLGLAILVYVNTERCCAKELAMLPGQICPEHRHPTVDGQPGKEETFRVRQGTIDLFLPGKGDRESALKKLPADKLDAVTVYRCVHLEPGEQYTLKPNTPHWFVAGPEGAVVSEFSTRSRDEADIFTDPAIVRVPE